MIGQVNTRKCEYEKAQWLCICQIHRKFTCPTYSLCEVIRKCVETENAVVACMFCCQYFIARAWQIEQKCYISSKSVCGVLVCLDLCDRTATRDERELPKPTGWMTSVTDVYSHEGREKKKQWCFWLLQCHFFFDMFLSHHKQVHLNYCWNICSHALPWSHLFSN